MNTLTLQVLLGIALASQMMVAIVQAETRHVWEKVEITLQSQRQYENPYTDVQVWVVLKGPNFDKRCYGFWDGGSTFRVRILATETGRWIWESGASAADPGLRGVRGEFTAVAWTEAERGEKPCRRGMIRPSGNGHALEYADGTPFFLLGDTWWATPTFRFPWHEDDTPRPLAGRRSGIRNDHHRLGRHNSIAAVPRRKDDVGHGLGFATSTSISRCRSRIVVP